MPKTTGSVEQAKDFDALMDIDFKLHAIMANLESQVVKDEDKATFPAELLLDAQKYMHVANKIMAKYPKVKAFKDQVELWTKGIDKALEVYPPEEGKISMWYSVMAGLKNDVINYGSNNIHDAALNLAGTATHLKSCEVQSFQGDEAGAVSKYCGGVIPISGKAQVHETKLQKLDFNGKPKVVSYGTVVEHFLGCHKAKTSFATESPESVNVAVQYSESGYPGSPSRLKGVHQRLEEQGMECSVNTNYSKTYPKTGQLYCWAKLSPDEIKTIATYFSLLLNGDVANNSTKPDFFNVIRDKAWEVAAKYNQDYGEDVWNKAPTNQLSWDSLYHEWQKEKELYEKKAIYTDLRNLLILRDKHHALEAEYGIEQGEASMTGMKKIAANADDFVKIVKDNKWSDNGVSVHNQQLKEIIAKGHAVPVTGTSDAIGNLMHMVVVKRLVAEKQYGNCPMTGDIININAGNLAYCEGVLNGTQANLHTAGNQIVHKTLPSTHTTYIGDSDLSKGYDLVYTLPKGEWSEELKGEFSKSGFKCSTNICKMYQPDLEKIRHLALFLSNLKGVDEKIGMECVQKAIKEAEDAAFLQNKKGTFSFTQEPIVDNPKAWVKKCQEKYDIMPPGLTEEEKVILKLIGPNKIYGGCSFEASDIIPNLGIIRYCEGVRKNPAANVSAYLNDSGILQHLFHGESAAHDQVTDVSINPDGKLYQVSLTDMDMKGSDNLRHASQKALQNWWKFSCTGMGCNTTAPLTEDSLRKLAGFLSSLHQAYNVPANCMDAAVNYAVNAANNLPDDLSAHDSLAYPFETKDWNKEVCSKLAGAPKAPEGAAAAAPGVPAGKKIDYGYVKNLSNTKGTPPFNVGGCVSTTAKKPTLAKASYCAGVLNQVAEPGGKTIDFKSAAALLTATGKDWHHIYNDGMVELDSKGFYIYITLPKEIAKLPGVVGHLTSASWKKEGCGFYASSEKENQFYRHWGNDVAKAALFLSRLASVTSLPEDCQAKAVEHAWSQALTMQTFPIYPANPHDWQSLVCGAKLEEGFQWEEPFVGYDADAHHWSVPCEHIQKLINDGIGKQVIVMSLGVNSNWPSPPGAIQDKPESFYEGIYNFCASMMKKSFASLSLVDKGKVKEFMKNEVIKGNPSSISTTEKQFNLIEEGMVDLYDIIKAELEEEKPVASKEVKKYILDLLEAPEYKGSWFTTIQVAQAVDLKFKASFGLQFITDLLGELLAENKVENDDSIWKAKGKIGFHQLTKDETEAIKNAVCDYKKAGKAIEEVYDWFAEIWSNVEFGAVTKSILTNFYNECPEAGNLDQLLEEAQAKWDLLAAKIYKDKTLLAKCKNAASYKKLPQVCKDLVHAYLNHKLLKNHKEGKKPEETLKEAQDHIIKTFPSLTPLQVKLQLEIEKKSKIRKGELPAEPGEKLAKKYEDLTGEEKIFIDEYIQQQSDYPTDTVIDFVFGTYGIPYSEALKDKIIDVQGGYKEEQVLSNIAKDIADWWQTHPEQIMSVKDIENVMKSNYGYLHLPDDVIIKALGELEGDNFVNELAEGWAWNEEATWEEKPPETKLHVINEMSDDELQQAEDFILSQMKQGTSIPVIKQYLADHFPGGIVKDDNYDNWVDNEITKLSDKFPGLVEKGKSYADLSDKEMSIVGEKIISLIKEDTDDETIAEIVSGEFNLAMTPALEEAIGAGHEAVDAEMAAVDWEEIIKEPWIYTNPKTGVAWGYNDVPEKYQPLTACLNDKLTEAGLPTGAGGVLFPSNASSVMHVLKVGEPEWDKIKKLWKECYDEFIIKETAVTLATDELAQAAKVLAGINGEPEIVAAPKPNLKYTWETAPEKIKQDNFNSIKNAIKSGMHSPDDAMKIYDDNPHWKPTKALHLAIAIAAAQVLEDEIKASMKKTPDFNEVKIHIIGQYPWVADMPGFVQFYDEVWSKNKGVEVTVGGEEYTLPPSIAKMNWQLVKNTINSIKLLNEQGFSLPNIINNTYSSDWHGVKPAEYKKWVQEVIKEAETKPSAVLTSVVLDEYIMTTMKQEPGKEFTPAEIHNMLIAEAGVDVSEEEIKETFQELVQEGKLQWVIGFDKYIYPEEPGKKSLTMKEWSNIILELLKQSGGEVFKTQDVTGNLVAIYGANYNMPSYDTVQDILNKLWKEKEIHSEGPNEWAWTGVKEEAERPEVFYEDLDQEDMDQVNISIAVLAKAGKSPDYILDEIEETHGLSFSKPLKNAIQQIWEANQTSASGNVKEWVMSFLQENPEVDYSEPDILYNMAESSNLTSDIEQVYKILNDLTAEGYLNYIGNKKSWQWKKQEPMVVIMDVVELIFSNNPEYYLDAEEVSTIMAAEDIELETLPSLEDIKTAMSELFHQGKLEYSTAEKKFRLKVKEEKPYLDKKALKAEILKLFHAAPNAAKSFSKLVDDIQSKYSIAQGNIVGAVEELVKEGAIEFVAGDTYQITAVEAVEEELKEISEEELISLIMGEFETLKNMTLANILMSVENAGYENPGILFVQNTLDKMVAEGKLKAQPEGQKTWYTLPPPKMPEKILDEDITKFIKMGWSPEAVADFYSEEDGKAVLKKAKKLYKIYEGEIRKVYVPYDGLNATLKAHLEGMAEEMLAGGKSQEDTVWYLHHNYSVEKESLKPMVRKLALKPLDQTKYILEAFKTLGIGEELAGCMVKSGLEELTPSVVAYCQGATAPIGQKSKAEILGAGRDIIHQMVGQGVDVTTTPTDLAKWLTKIAYGTSKDGNWKERIEGIKETMESWKFSCDDQDIPGNMYCTLQGEDGGSLPIADQDRIRRAALFLSMIENVDQLPKECIPKAIKYFKEKAVNANQTNKPWTVPAYPSSVEDMAKMICGVGG